MYTKIHNPACRVVSVALVHNFIDPTCRFRSRVVSFVSEVDVRARSCGTVVAVRGKRGEEGRARLGRMAP